MSLPNFLKFSLLLVLAAAIAGCALFPSSRWEKKGASEADYKFDETQCKAKTYAGNDGAVTNATVRRMHACLQERGWSRVPN